MFEQAPSESSIDHLSADLRIYMLGVPFVEEMGRTLPIPRRQARALLYRLAAQLQAVSREHLCFLFWPDIPESKARRKLSRLIHHLRRALSARDLLIVTDDWVALDPGRVWSDIATFERLSSALRHGRQAEGLAQAVELYRGPFLAGFSLSDRAEFEQWAIQERQAWERQYLNALRVLIEEQSVLGHHDTAITYAQRYLATDELAEDMHRRLMALYAASGDRSAALRQFERCSAAFRRELGVEPLPETQLIYQAIMEGRFQRSDTLPTERAWTVLPGLNVPLVGRDEGLSS